MNNGLMEVLQENPQLYDATLKCGEELSKGNVLFVGPAAITHEGPQFSTASQPNIGFDKETVEKIKASIPSDPNATSLSL